MNQYTKMQHEMIDGSELRQMFRAAYYYMEQHCDEINALNVFPVPDGDTGSNMTLTLRAVEEAMLSMAGASVSEVAAAAAKSALLGARGNSGVILSQFLRGISRGLQGKQQATSKELSKSFQYSIIYAYRAVARPVEGTILSVARDMAKGARSAVRADKSICEVIRAAVDSGQAALLRTTEQLPVLKQAGVVDAGGKGLLVFMEGCYRGLLGDMPDITTAQEKRSSQSSTAVRIVYNADIKYPYCTELLVRGGKIPYAQLRSDIENMGDSLVLVEGEDLVKIHIHTDRPGKVLELAVGYGTLHNIKIDNMIEQHEHRLVGAQEESQTEQELDIAVVAVAPGNGIGQIFRTLGVDLIVAGGQTMNPSVSDFMDAIKTLPAKEYIILANNKNIILAIEQLRKLNTNVHPVPSRTIPQGMAAMMAFERGDDAAAAVQKMKERMLDIKSGAITRAVRDANMNGVSIEVGAYIGLNEEKIVTSGREIQEVVMKLLGKMLTGGEELLTLYYGEELTELEAQDIVQAIHEHFAAIEIELLNGGQPHYQLIVSAE